MKFDMIQEGSDLLWMIPASSFSLAMTLQCGQCFRFSSTDGQFSGVANGRLLRMQQTDQFVRFFDMSLDEFHAVWANYFDCETDYDALHTLFSSDPTLCRAIEHTGGIRVLRQDGFETLISFLISQNNNIPRITKSIALLCERFGDPIEEHAFSFPDAKTLSSASLSDFAGLSLGYRDRYLLDAAQKVSSGEIDLLKLYTCPIEEARQTLRTICGVGPKVAECVLLFGFARLSCVPMDTWMKKVMARYYQAGLPKEILPYAGIAQQYLFHYARCFDTF